MQRNSIAFFMIVVLVDSIGFGIIIPVMPSLLLQLGAGDVRHAVGLGGWLTFAYAIMQFVCAPIAGALSDRFGRRPVLLASMFAFALDYALMAIVPYAWLLFIGRLVAGATGACYPTANAAIADVTPPELRAKNFGLTGMAFGVGFIIGPPAGGLIGTLGPRAPFVAAAILAGLNFLYGLFLVPETLALEKRRDFYGLPLIRSAHCAISRAAPKCAACSFRCSSGSSHFRRCRRRGRTLHAWHSGGMLRPWASHSPSAA